MLTYQRAGVKQEKRSERERRDALMPEIIPAVANVSRQLRCVLFSVEMVFFLGKVEISLDFDRWPSKSYWIRQYLTDLYFLLPFYLILPSISLRRLMCSQPI